MARADFDFRATRRRCQVQRTIECRQHPALDVIKRGRLPIAWPRKRRFNFLKDASWPGTHDHDAISEHNRFINVVSNEDKSWLEIGPKIQQMVLQADPGECVERGKWFVEEQDLWPRH